MIKVNNEVVHLKYFPDGTLNIKGNGNLHDGEVLISWHYHDDAEFMAVAMLTKWYQAMDNDVILYMPYVPNARMDRVEAVGDIMTAKYFCEMINSLNYKKVFIMDAHSNAIVATLKNVMLINSFPILDRTLRKICEIEGELPIMFYPDEGAMKRYAKDVKIPFAFGVKNRDWNTGKIISLEVFGFNADEIKGKNILIRDDICSYGGTFYYAAKKLKEMGANNIYLMVTHCENNIRNGRFGKENVNLLETGLIKKVFTTDSIYTNDSSDMISVVTTGVDIDSNKNEEHCDCCNHCCCAEETKDE